MATTKKAKSISFPATITKFNTGFNQLMLHLGAADPDSGSTALSYVRLGMTLAQYNLLVGFLAIWNTNYPLAAHRATRNNTNEGKRNGAKKSALIIIRAFRLGAKADEKLTPGFLTEGDAQYLFIPDVGGGHNTSVANLRIAPHLPVVSIHAIKHLEHVVDVHDSDNPKSTALPPGIHFIELLYCISATQPTTESQYTRVALTGRFRTISHYTEAQVTAAIPTWYVARYISTIGIEGDLSAPIKAVIA